MIFPICVGCECFVERGKAVNVHECNRLPAALYVTRGLFLRALVFAEGSVHGWEDSEPRLSQNALRSLAKFHQCLK